MNVFCVALADIANGTLAVALRSHGLAEPRLVQDSIEKFEESGCRGEVLGNAICVQITCDTRPHYCRCAIQYFPMQVFSHRQEKKITS